MGLLSSCYYLFIYTYDIKTTSIYLYRFLVAKSNPYFTFPFNITIIQVYAPTSGHDDSEVDHFYQQLQETIDKTPKKDILVVQGDWNAKVGKDAQADWGEVCGPYCNVETNERGLRLLEFATFNNLVLTNTLGPHKPSRRWTWHSPDGKHHNQIDYILVKKRFRSGVNIHRTRSFSWSRHRK